MSKQKLSIRYVISIAKTNKKGLCPISCRLTLDGKRKPFSTGLFINPTEWNSKQQKALSKLDGGSQLNLQLEFITNDIKKAYLHLQLSGGEFSVEDIFNNYIGKPTAKEVGTILYFKEFLDKKKKLVGIDIQLGTWKKYNYACQQIERYVKWKFKKTDIPLGDLTLQFLVDFEYYLKTEKDQSQVTINKAIQRFRKPIKEAVAEGYLEKDPFALHKPGRVKKEVIFLSVNELDKLEKYLFTQPRLDLVKDLFIFCCFTGIAYHEMSNLKKEHIIKGFDGNEWIQMKKGKNRETNFCSFIAQCKSNFS